MADSAVFQQAADQLLAAYGAGGLCAPVRDLIGPDPDAGYAVQAINTALWVQQGRRIVGRKIGLTSAAVQKQLGVDQPDFGVLFADMEYGDGDEVPLSLMQQPRAEAEVALVLSRDLPEPDVTPAELVRAVDFVMPAIEIVSSRILGWDISISDTIADNASSGLYVLGGPVRPLAGVDLVNAGMVLKCNGRPVSYGAGIACLGSPLNAALWLARKSAALGTPLRAGDVIMTGALGPMVPVAAGDVFEATISGLGNVRFSASKN